MKVGIYTQPLRYNYGGLLQAWALQTVLERMGHEAHVLDPYPYISIPYLQRPIVYGKRMLLKMAGKHKGPIFIEHEKNKVLDIKMTNLKPFISKHINRMGYRFISEISESEYDVLIAGSDQVWRPRYNTSYGRSIENSFLDFAQNWDVKRVAYAASFGADQWEYSEQQTMTCKKLAALFAAISVREFSGVYLCKEYLSVPSVQVLDPTMLLAREDYVSLIEPNSRMEMPQGNLLCYVLDETPDKNALIKRIASERSLIPFRANSRAEEKGARKEEMVQPSVEQWLSNFQHASFVITDSFHACVFSIIFNVPFVAIGNKTRGADRFNSLLGLFGLERNLISSIEDVDNKYSYCPNVYNSEQMIKLKQYSLRFLQDVLH